MKLSDFIRKYIEDNDISGRELARRCGLSSQTIFNIIKGVNKDGRPYRVDTETLVKIANGTGQPSARFATVNGVYHISLPGEHSDAADVPAFGQEEDLTDVLESLRTRPELRMLFESSKNMSPDQVRAIVQMIEGFRK